MTHALTFPIRFIQSIDPHVREIDRGVDVAMEECLREVDVGRRGRVRAEGEEWRGWERGSLQGMGCM